MQIVIGIRPLRFGPADALFVTYEDPLVAYRRSSAHPVYSGRRSSGAPSLRPLPGLSSRPRRRRRRWMLVAAIVIGAVLGAVWLAWRHFSVSGQLN